MSQTHQTKNSKNQKPITIQPKTPLLLIYIETKRAKKKIKRKFYIKKLRLQKNGEFSSFYSDILFYVYKEILC
jgi:hypothetical protein